MAGFRTHITVSTLGGVAYGYAGAQLGLAIPTCVLAGGLCSIAGMMPDLDSDSGVPARETVGFAAAIAPMLMLHRMQALGFSIEQMVLAGAAIYMSIRFGIGWLLKTLSVHRGMFHSIPAALIAGLIAFLICDSSTHFARYYKALAVTLGYLIHLVLDEIWSLEFGAGIPRAKKSLGTAVKLFGHELVPNLATYCLLAALGYTAFEEDPSFWKNITSIRKLRDAESTATKPKLDESTR